MTAVPDTKPELHLFLCEMLAEMAEHYGIPVEATEIERHVRISLKRRAGRPPWRIRLEALSKEGELLLEASEQEDRHLDEMEAKGETPITRPWTWKLTPRH